MSTLLDELTQYLEQQGVGTRGVDIFTAPRTAVPSLGTGTPPPPQPTIPTRTGPILILSETGGTKRTTTHGRAAIERPSVHISARGVDSPTARTKLQLAYDALGGADGLHNTMLPTVAGSFYPSLTPRGSIMDQGQDASGRAMLSFNVDIERSVPATGTVQNPSWIQVGWFQ